MMSALRVVLLVLGALPVPACRSRPPQAPAAAGPAAPVAVESLAVTPPGLPAPSPRRAARERRIRTAEGAGAPADTLAEAGPRSGAGFLLVSDRTLGRGRATLIAGRARGGGASAGGTGLSVGARPASESDSLQQVAPLLEPPRARAFRPVAILVLADHRVDPGTGLEHTSSLMYGAGFEVTTRGWLSLRGELTTGTLAAEQTGVRDRSVTDARLELGMTAFPWLTLLAGGGLRVYKQDAQENWRFLRVGAEAHFPLGVEALTGTLRFTLSPWVTRSTSALTTLSPSFALSGASGLRLNYRRLSAAFEYFMESYTFPSSGGVTRLEQFSGLKLRLGLNLGW